MKTTENAIEIINLTKSFGEKKAVKNLNLSVRKNELMGLLGVNGAGKTTSIRMICCLCKPTEGDILVDGFSVLKESNSIKKLINLSPQETAVAPNLTVKENLELIAGMYGLSKERIDNNVAEAVRNFDLEEILGQRAGTLSGGWQRRLSIAMALVTDPQILFLDEPTLGLDVIARRELWNTIRKLKKKITIVLTTHYLEEAEALCDRIAIMVKGELKALGTADELKEQAGCDDFEEAFVRIAGGDHLSGNTKGGEYAY